MKKIKKILWDVDTQYDFIMPTGTLVVPGAYEMMDNFGKTIEHFEKKGIHVLGSVDAHMGPEPISGTKDQYFPLHCIKGTLGQTKIPSTLYNTPFSNILYVSDQKYTDEALDMIVTDIMRGKRAYFEKQEHSFSANPNAKYILEKIGVEEVYLMGVATNICVKLAHDAFKDMGIKRYLVDNAIKGLDLPGNTEKDSIDEMLDSGAQFYTASDKYAI